LSLNFCLAPPVDAAPPKEETQADVTKVEAKTERAKDTEESKEEKEQEADSKSEKRNGKPAYKDNRKPHDNRRGFKRYNENVKTDFESLPETDDPDDIRQQVLLLHFTSALYHF
jgi:hypothetical protein